MLCITKFRYNTTNWICVDTIQSPLLSRFTVSYRKGTVKFSCNSIITGLPVAIQSRNRSFFPCVLLLENCILAQDCLYKDSQLHHPLCDLLNINITMATWMKWARGDKPLWQAKVLKLTLATGQAKIYRTFYHGIFAVWMLVYLTLGSSSALDLQHCS